MVVGATTDEVAGGRVAITVLVDPAASVEVNTTTVEEAATLEAELVLVTTAVKVAVVDPDVEVNKMVVADGDALD